MRKTQHPQSTCIHPINKQLMVELTLSASASAHMPSSSMLHPGRAQVSQHTELNHNDASQNITNRSTASRTSKVDLLQSRVHFQRLGQRKRTIVCNKVVCAQTPSNANNSSTKSRRAYWTNSQIARSSSPRLPRPMNARRHHQFRPLRECTQTQYARRNRRLKDRQLSRNKNKQ